MANHIKALPQVYVNAGKRDVTLNGYFNMPERVFRNGQWIDIRDNNACIMKRKRHG